MPAPAIVWHGKPTQFGHHVRAMGQVGHVVLPLLEYLFALVGIGADTDGRPEMVEHHGRIRHRLHQVEIVPVLVVIVPCVIGQVVLAQQLHAPAKIFIRIETLRRPAWNAQRSAARIT